ncbi:MAG TPA: hypothetical protein VKB03_15120 [Conexibacter sp.]|nr:hypothetical protein [Conexibacter sp.]
MTLLQNLRTVIVELGEEVLNVQNLVAVAVYIYVDWQLPNGQWSAISGEVRLEAGAVYARTAAELGHERVRVGVRVIRGEVPGNLVEVNP